MKKVIITLVVALISISAMAHEEDPVPFIEIKGTAEMEVTPDEVYISININEKDSKGKLSIESQQDSMVVSLKNLDIDIDKNLKVLSMASEAFRRKDAVTSAKYELMVATPLMVERVYDALNELGINDISITKVTHSKVDEYNKELQIKALQNAKEQAKAIVKGIDQKLMKCFSIQMLNNNSYRNPRYDNNTVVIRGMSSNGAGTGSAQKLDFKKIKLEASVLAKFVIW